MRKIEPKKIYVVLTRLVNFKTYFGEQFNQVFKSITSYNSQEVVKLSKVQQTSFIKVYFSHPYASDERGNNKRRNGLLRRFIPKDLAIDEYSMDEIVFIEDWCNTLQRKMLNDHMPDEVFGEELDTVYERAF